MRSFIVAAAVVATSAIGAQAYNITAIPESTRVFWCQAQVAECPNLCRQMGKSATTNECYPDNLYYSCLCSGQVAPNSTEVIQTIPYFTCSLNQADCVAGCGPNAECSNACKKTFKCAATAPTLVNITGSTTASAPSTSKTSTGGTCNGFACDEGTDQKKDPKSDGVNLKASGLIAAGIAVGVAMMGL